EWPGARTTASTALRRTSPSARASGAPARAVPDRACRTAPRAACAPVASSRARSPSAIAQPLHDRGHVQSGRVQRRQRRDLLAAEQQGQLRPAKDDAIEPLLYAQPVHDRRELATRAVVEFTMQQLADIDRMNPAALVLGRNNHVDL